MSDMQEIELKFQVPQSALAAVQDELAGLTTAKTKPQRLQAAYFDTPDRKLAKARAALRVRQEDDDWVQTLKAAGANAMTRLEDNQPARPPLVGAPIRPDLSLHQAPAVRDALMRDLGWEPASDPRGERVGLTQLYRTDMLRTRATLDTSHVAKPGRAGVVELALDLGLIAAQDRSIPVQELEIELVEGHPQAVLDVARGFVLRHGLWLDAQTKAHRGDQLAREASSGGPSPLPPARPRTRSGKPVFQTGSTPKQTWLAGLDTALEHIQGNVSEVASQHGASGHHDADLTPWIKGWACGLRRLLWVWRHAPVGEHLEAALADRVTHIARTLLLRLRPSPGHYASKPDAVALARTAELTLLSLDVLAAIVSGQGDQPE